MLSNGICVGFIHIINYYKSVVNLFLSEKVC